jgi:hypothetical protein
MKWFRFWVDILDDVKMLQLTDYEYRMWTYILAYACSVDSESGECNINVDSFSLRCRTRVSHLKHALETFQTLGLITLDESGLIKITNWNKRQFKSDNTYERVKKFREVTLKRNVSCNVSETVPDTDTDTDKKKYIKKTHQPGNGIFHPPTLEEVSAYCLERGNAVDPERFMNHYEANGWMRGKSKIKNWKATVRTWEGSEYSKTSKKYDPDEWSMPCK